MRWRHGRSRGETKYREIVVRMRLNKVKTSIEDDLGQARSSCVFIGAITEHHIKYSLKWFCGWWVHCTWTLSSIQGTIPIPLTFLSDLLVYPWVLLTPHCPPFHQDQKIFSFLHPPSSHPLHCSKNRSWNCLPPRMTLCRNPSYLQSSKHNTHIKIQIKSICWIHFIQQYEYSLAYKDTAGCLRMISTWKIYIFKKHKQLCTFHF